MGCARGAAPITTVVLLAIMLTTTTLTLPSAAHLPARRRFPPSQDGQGLRCRLYCHSGYYLQVHADGTVNGTRDADTRCGLLQMMRVTVKLVSIRGVAAGTYLCMTRKGKIYTSEKRNSECVFMEEYLETSYHVYSSKKYSRRRKKMYIAISRRGRIKKGRRRNQGSVQFYVRAVDDANWTDTVPGNTQEADDSLEDWPDD